MQTKPRWLKYMNVRKLCIAPKWFITMEREMKGNGRTHPPPTTQQKASSSSSPLSVASAYSVSPTRCARGVEIVSHPNRFNKNILHAFVAFQKLPGATCTWCIHTCTAIKRKICVVCSQKMRIAKLKGDNSIKHVDRKTGCTGCPGISLCDNHFLEYHDETWYIDSISL